MFGDGSLTFWEFATREPLLLATIQDEILEFLRGREDAVLVGAQGPVADRLHEARATENVLSAWKDLVAQEILPEDEDAGY